MQPFLPSTPADGTSPKILLAIEQEWAARSLESVLAPNGFAVIRAHSGHATLDLAGRITPDLVVVDSRLSDMDPLDVCRTLRDRSLVEAHVPVVITTSGPASREFIVDAHRAGVWGVWEQPLDGEVLLLRLATWIRAKRVADGVNSDSLVDRGSGLYSLRGLTVRTREIVSHASRSNTPTSCVAVSPMVRASDDASADAAMSPAVLREVARIIAASSRDGDAVGKVGLSEFAVVAPQTSAQGARELAHRLRTAVSGLAAVGTFGASRIELQVGIATISEEAAMSSDPVDLLVRASTALRVARHQSASATSATAAGATDLA